MKFLPVLVAAAVTAAGAAQAQLVTNPAQVKPGTYKVEPYHTRVLFAVSHFGLTTYYGEFTGTSGSLTLDPAHAANDALSISIPTANVSTSNPVLNGELKAPDWFDAAKYPAITFVSSKVTPVGHGMAKVAGMLTMHGVSKPLTLTAKLNGAMVNPIDHAYTVGFEVTGQLKRSDFGVSKYVPFVGDAVTLMISAAFEAK